MKMSKEEKDHEDEEKDFEFELDIPRLSFDTNAGR